MREVCLLLVLGPRPFQERRENREQKAPRAKTVAAQKQQYQHFSVLALVCHPPSHDSPRSDSSSCKAVLKSILSIFKLGFRDVLRLNPEGT